METRLNLLLFGTACSLKKIPLGSDVMQAGRSVIKSAAVVRDLGVMLDAQLTMRNHISRTAQVCFFHLRRLRSVRYSLGRDVTIQLGVALVFSRLDYCNAVLAGLPATTLAPLQRVLHAAARLVNGIRPRDHVTLPLSELHWLPIAQRIECKLCLLVHKSIVGQAPVNMKNLLTSVADVPSRSALHEAMKGNFLVPRTCLKLGERALLKRSLKTFLFQTAYNV